MTREKGCETVLSLYWEISILIRQHFYIEWSPGLFINPGVPQKGFWFDKYPDLIIGKSRFQLSEKMSSDTILISIIKYNSKFFLNHKYLLIQIQNILCKMATILSLRQHVQGLLFYPALGSKVRTQCVTMIMFSHSFKLKGECFRLFFSVTMSP